MRRLSFAPLALLVAAPALATLTETPITWNVIGLNSNSPASGPNHFPVGARVCSNVATTNVGVNWVWDSANPNVNLRPGSLTSITFPSIAAGACADAYFEVEVTPVAAAFDTARRYHITASDFSGTVSTPRPRELYVEHLFPQNRNTTTDVKLNGVSVPAGGTMSLVVGNTYTIELDTTTATLGYEQLEQFINFSNTVFQILSISTTYSVDTSTRVPDPNDKLYADGCGWENDPNSPNYRSCVGVLAKAGGTVVTTYTVRIVGGGGTSQTLNSLIYDFSGTSFRYNSDFGAGARVATVVDPTLVTISKRFAPSPATAGGVSRLIFTLANPNAGFVGSLGFIDIFPTSPGAMVVASPPAASTAGCGATTFAPAAGAASIFFSNGSVAPNGICEVSVNVTAPAAGTYTNTSGHLFIGTVDTGSSASGTLNVNPASPPPLALPPTIALVFSPNPVPVGDDSTLTITVTNPNSSIPLTGLAFTNSLPPGLPAPDGTTSSCGGTLTISGKSLLTFTGGSIAAGASCSIAIPVTATTAVPDLVVIGFISATESGANTGPSGFGVDTLTKILPPVTAKNFSPDPILPFAVSTLTFHIHNPNDGDALESVEFGDTFPTSPGAMVVAGTPAATVSGCGTPVFSPVAGAPSVSFTGGTIAQGDDCLITVDVTASVVGTYTNISEPVSYKKDTKKHEGNAAVDSLTVNPPGPAIGALKQVGLTNDPLGTWSSFLAVPAGTNVFYKITIQNDGDVVLSPVGASDPIVNLLGCTWPPSLPVAVAGNENHIATCVVGPVAAASGLHPNTVTASGTGGGQSVTATSTATYATTGLTIAKSVAETSFSAAGDLLHYSYLVTNTGFATLPGPVTVTDTKAPVTCPALTSIGNHDDSFDPGESMTCTATYTVIPADVSDLLVKNQALATVSGLNSPIVSKTVPLAGTITITKSFASASVAIGSTVIMDFALSNPSGTPRSGIAFADTLPAGLTAPNGTTAACGGSLTVSGGSSLSFSGGSLAPGESCAIESTVTGTTAGVKNNTTGPISSNEGGVVGTSNTATVTVVAPPTIGKTFGTASIALSGSTTLNLALANPNATAALSGIAFTDSFPSGLTAPNGTTTPCGGTLTTTGSNLLTFTGGVLAASANCTVMVTVTGASAGIKNNTTSAVTASGPLSLTGTVSNTATITVTAPSPPTIAKSFAAPEVALGGAVDLSFLLSNSSATPLTGVAFADALPAGLTAPNGTTTPCGGTLVIAGGTGLAFTGGTLAATGNCTITVPVTGAAVGVKDNRTGPIGSTESGTGGPSNTARVTVLAPPAIEKSFVEGSIPLAGTTGMDLILTNPNAAVALTGIAFTDTLPSGLTATDGTTTPCGGSLVISGSNLLTFTGGTVAAAGTCTISVPVTGVAAGVQNNTTSAVTATGPVLLTGTTSNTSAVTVTPPGAPTVHKAFAALDVALGGTVDMSFLLNNPSATPLTGVAFPDTLPAGLTATDGTTMPCGGTLTITGGTGLAFTGGTLAAGGSCTITVPVTGTATGVAHNTTGPISSTESGADGTSNTATVTVLAPPTIAKAFGSGSIPLSGSTSLDLTMANPNATVALTGIDFTDTLPAGLSAPSGTTTCGGTLTVTLGNLLTFTGGSLAAGGSCPISVTVTGVAAGLQNNTTSAITSTGPIPLNGTTSNTASVTVTAPGAPTITKSFAGAHVALGGTVDMSFSMTNSSVTPLTGVAFTDSLPAGLTAPDGSTPVCGGTLTILGGNALTFSGGTLGPGATCTITLTVTGSAAGAQNNTTGPITSTESGAGGPSNTATVTVVAPPAISKAFGAPSIVIGATTSLGVTLTNPNAAVPLTGVAFIDPLPAGLSTPDATTSPCGGSLVITGNLLTFTGGMLGAGGTCTITVTVTAEFAGVKNNTTTTVTAAGPVALTGNSASASVTVAPATPPTIVKSFAAADVAFGGTVNMSFVVTNPNATGLTGVSFGDVLPAGLTAPNGTTATCGGSLTITGGDALAFADGSLAGSSSCTITVPVTGALAGVFNNTTGPIISTESGLGATSNTARVTVLAPPTISKAFDAPSILVGGRTNLTLRLTNPNGTAALTGLAFTDPLPGGLTTPNGATSPCGGSLTVTGGDLLTFTGGTIGAGGLCLITVSVTGASAGLQNNTTSVVTASGPVAQTGNTATASVTVTPATPPTIAKSFASPDVAVNGTTSMSFVLTNPNASGLTGVAFSDALPAGLTAPNGTTTLCGGTLVIAGGTGLTFSGGTLAAGASCTIVVTVTGATVGVKNNTTGPISSAESGAGAPSNTATVTVTAPGAPMIVKSFSAAHVALGGTVDVIFVVTNPSQGPVTGLALTDVLPSGLTAPNGTSPSCGGTLAVTGGNRLTLSGGTLAGGASCTITVPLTGSTAGVQINTTGPISSTETGAGGPSNPATVTVLALPTITKTFGVSSMPVNGTTSLDFTLGNPNATVPFSGLAFTDALPSGLTAPNGTTTPCGGTLTIAGGNLLTFTGGTLAAGGSCTITVTVTGTATGAQNNTTSPLTASGPLSVSGTPSNTATVTVGGAAAAGIPAVSPWMLLALAALLGLAGVRFARR